MENTNRQKFIINQALILSGVLCFSWFLINLSNIGLGLSYARKSELGMYGVVVTLCLAMLFNLDFIIKISPLQNIIPKRHMPTGVLLVVLAVFAFFTLQTFVWSRLLQP